MAASDILVEAIVQGVVQELKGHIGQKPQRRLLTVEQAAEYMGYTPAAVRHMVARNQVPCVRKGRTLRFDVGDLDGWIEDHKRDGSR